MGFDYKNTVCGHHACSGNSLPRTPFLNLLATITFVVIALDDEEKVVLANPAAGRLLSFDPAEAAGRPLLEVARKRIGIFISSSPRIKTRDSHRIER